MRDNERPFYLALGERICDARKASGFSQARLGRHLGLTRASVGNIEAGRQIVSAYDLALMVDFIGLSVPWLGTNLDMARVISEHAKMEAVLHQVRGLVKPEDAA